MTKFVLLLGAAGLLASCGQAADDQGANGSANAASNAAEPAHPTYCFFKEAETKGWTVGRDASGNLAVKGKGHVKDSRYKAVLGEPEVASDKATLWLSIGTNGSGYAAPEDWWDVEATIPTSASVGAVTILCGSRTVAELNAPH